MKLVFLTLILAFSIQSHAVSQSPSEVSVANPNRPAEDKKADANRHPKELLDFSKVKAGDRVVDLLPGRGYFTRLFASIVGDRGQVIAYVPKEFEKASFKPVDSAKQAVKGLPNAKVAVTPILTAPEKNVDVVWTSQNYHDLHIKKFLTVDLVEFNKVVFKMLKPGGYYIVVDHVGPAGSKEADTERLHRIDPALVKKEIEAAGFVLEEEGKTLSRSENHSLNVFDPSIRGQTDQFMYRFVKPKK